MVLFYCFRARDGGWGSSLSGHSFFDIALTALAFLSFGIFLLNLLLNALLVRDVSNSKSFIILVKQHF